MGVLRNGLGRLLNLEGVGLQRLLDLRDPAFRDLRLGHEIALRRVAEVGQRLEGGLSVLRGLRREEVAVRELRVVVVREEFGVRRLARLLVGLRLLLLERGAVLLELLAVRLKLLGLLLRFPSRLLRPLCGLGRRLCRLLSGGGVLV